MAIKNGLVIEGSATIAAAIPTVKYTVLCNHDEEFGCGKKLGAVVELPLAHPNPDEPLRGYLCPACSAKHQTAVAEVDQKLSDTIERLMGPGHGHNPSPARMIEMWDSIMRRIDKLEGKTPKPV